MSDFVCEICQKDSGVKLKGNPGKKRLLCDSCYSQISTRCRAEVKGTIHSGFRCSNSTIDETCLCSSHEREEVETIVRNWEKCPNCGTFKISGNPCPEHEREKMALIKKLDNLSNQTSEYMYLVRLSDDNGMPILVYANFSEKKLLDLLDDVNNRTGIVPSIGKGETWDIISEVEFDQRCTEIELKKKHLCVKRRRIGR